ncbi:hypothetical protein ABFT80_26265 [Mesorhizobium sp. SB112]|uniref:hypothetical protein n=1 Tax=Mesorhizobium sp. SB112 TaxID=3151853 RepID=UPI003267ACC6
MFGVYEAKPAPLSFLDGRAAERLVKRVGVEIADHVMAFPVTLRAQLQRIDNLPSWTSPCLPVGRTRAWLSLCCPQECLPRVHRLRRIWIIAMDVKHDPAMSSLEIPGGFMGTALPLWRFELRPNFDLKVRLHA